MNQGGNYWTLFTPGIWKVLHAFLQEMHRFCVRTNFACRLTDVCDTPPFIHILNTNEN